MTNLRRMLLGLGLLALLAPAAGCAKEPVDQINAANEAYERAAAPEVAEYAPDTADAAKDAKSRLDAELDAQRAKFAMLRNYDAASELAANVRTTSDQAVADAAAGKERAREEATTAIAEARRAHARARDLLAEAPAGKGTQADIALLKSDLDGVEVAINDADSTFQTGRFMEAKAKADAARQSAENVESQIVAAKQARTGPRPTKT